MIESGRKELGFDPLRLACIRREGSERVSKKGQETSMNVKNLLFAAAVAMLPAIASAGTAEFSVSGTSGGEAAAAKLTFSTAENQLLLSVENTVSGIGLKRSQAISSIIVTFKTGFAVPTALYDLTGSTISSSALDGGWTATSGTFYSRRTTALGTLIDWGFASGSPTAFSLTAATAKSPTAGAGNPQLMIVPTSGNADSSLASNTNFDPYLIGPAKFTFTRSGLTTASSLAEAIASVTVGFGTGPDNSLTDYTPDRITETPGDTPSGSVLPVVPTPAAVLGGSVLMGATLLRRKLAK